MKVAIVLANFYPKIGEALLAGVQKIVGTAPVYNVPGTYEVPLMVKKLADSKKFDGIIALGCVIRGDTIHFDLISQSTAWHLQKISIESGLPVTSGILMVENEAQAWERLGGKKGHRGEEAAKACLAMIESLKV